MGFLFRTNGFLPGIDNVRTTTRYCKKHSNTSRKKEPILEAFHRNAFKKEAWLDELEKPPYPDFPGRKKASREKNHRGMSKKTSLFYGSKKRVRPDVSHRKVYPSQKGEEAKWRGTGQIWTVRDWRDLDGEEDVEED